jgi:hypothetical protein
MFVKWIIEFLMEVQMYSLIHLSEYNYEANGTLWSKMYSQSTNKFHSEKSMSSQVRNAYEQEEVEY